MKYITVASLFLIIIIFAVTYVDSISNESRPDIRNSKHEKRVNNNKFTLQTKNKIKPKTKTKNEDYLIEIADAMTEMTLNNEAIDTFFEM